MSEPLTHRQKVDILIADLRHHGVSGWTTAPPLWRLMWLLGLRVPPPHFIRPLTMSLVTGTLFRVLWGLFMWHLQWRGGGVPPWFAGLAAFVAGSIFGFILAGYYRWWAYRLRLPAWADYPGVIPPEEIEPAEAPSVV